MYVKTLKTTEFTDELFQAYHKVFEEVYETKRELYILKNEYLNTYLGYSFHSILFNENNEVCGSYTFSPFLYNYKDTQIVVAVGIDLFIRETFRKDVNNLLSVINSAINNIKSLGISICIGFPNDNSDKVSRAFLKEKRIGLLDTYILPYKIGDYKKSFKFLNPFSLLFSKLILFSSYLSFSNKKDNCIITKLRPQFENIRFKWFNPKDYHICKIDDMQYVWKISSFNGIKACFLMDVYPLTPKNFNKAVRGMVNNAKEECGLFLYVGHLKFTPLSMIKIPRRFEPKTFRFDCRILDKKKILKEDIFNIDNWEIDLSSYDLL